MTVIGEPGLGKSRIVAELGAYVDGKPELTTWRQGRCLPYGEGITFWALGEILKAHAGISESDTPTVATTKLDAVLPEGEEQAWFRQRLLPLLGIESSSKAEREELFTAWRRFTELVAATVLKAGPSRIYCSTINRVGGVARSTSGEVSCARPSRRQGLFEREDDVLHVRRYRDRRNRNAPRPAAELSADLRLGTGATRIAVSALCETWTISGPDCRLFWSEEERGMDKDTASIDPVTIIGDTTVKPFAVDFEQGAIDDLRRRIDATRWPTKELVADRSQGVQLAATRALARFWATEYDWRKCEARLNALPQFKTELDGLNIHFIHVKSPHANALPLVMTHGWPGSIIELLEIIGPLTDPTAHGGNEEDAFHLVLPSVPGYGFSDEPTEVGWGPIRIGRAWHELMRRLGYTRYVAQGGDVGSQVTDAMGRLSLDGLLGIHTNLLTPALGDANALSASPPTEEERAALDQLDEFHATGTGYFVEQATRPETIGYALLDSPVDTPSGQVASPRWPSSLPPT